VSALTIAQLQSLAASVGFPDPALAAAIAMAESGGNPCAQGDPNIGSGGYSCTTPNGTSTSFGLWQVNTPANPRYDASSLLGATYNAQAAYAISRQGTNWNPWTTYRTGAYKHWYSPNAPNAPGAAPSRRLTNAQAAVIGVGILALAAYAARKIHPKPLQLRTRWA
jgi:hypothetical protein